MAEGGPQCQKVKNTSTSKHKFRLAERLQASAVGPARRKMDTPSRKLNPACWFVGPAPTPSNHHVIRCSLFGLNGLVSTFTRSSHAMKARKWTGIHHARFRRYAIGPFPIIVEIESACPSSYYPSTHTACSDPSPNAGNPKGVTATEQATIVAEHNKYRASVDATDMQMTYWDTELALVAQKLAEKCSFDHDQNSEREILCKYSAGQNLARGYSNWAEAIQGWYSEKSKFTYGSSANVLEDIGHYTQVMWSTSAKVGCGASYCSNYNQQIYVCNYALPGNLPSSLSTPYAAGTRCSACPSSCKNGLCDCGGLVCKNGGVLNINTCTCTCQPPYQGSADCNLNCNGVTDPAYCNKPQPFGYPAEFCSTFSNVPRECPLMCGVCPGAACLELQSIVLGDRATSSNAAGPTNTTTRKPCKLHRRK